MMDLSEVILGLSTASLIAASFDLNQTFMENRPVCRR